jgi:hypothetical protein
MRSIRSNPAIKLVCRNSSCKEFNKYIYRAYDALIEQICSSCHSTLSRPTNKSLLRSDIKARRELQLLSVEDNNV